MQFVVIAHDFTDDQVLERRLAARAAHIALSNEAIKAKQQIFAVAMLNEQENMCGSVMVVRFPARKGLEEWLAREPYMTRKVWEKVEVIPCMVGPSFLHLLPANCAD